MPLQRQQRVEVFELVSALDLDPREFRWAPPQFPTGVDRIEFTPLEDAYFEFVFANDWWSYYKPGDGIPSGQFNQGSWRTELQALHQWLLVCKREAEAPDLWGALVAEREALTHPGAGADEENTPFAPSEIEEVRRQMEALKAYAAEAFALRGDTQRELNAKLDYLVGAAERSPGRIDWWNQFTGVLLNLAVSQVLQPGPVQALLVMGAHGLSHLFGGSPPELMA